MNGAQKKQFLQFVEKIMNHPISTLFNRGTSELENQNFDAVRNKIQNGDYRTLAEIVDDMYRIIKEIQKYDEIYLQRAGDEILRLINKEKLIYFPDKNEWRENVSRLRSKLTDYTVNVPAKVKLICQWPSRSSIRKPDVHLFSDNDYMNLVKQINSHPEVSDKIKEIILQENPNADFSEEINLAKLSGSTLSRLQSCFA